MRFVFTTALLISLAWCAQAQQVTLKGTVTAQDGKPVPFESIYIKNTTNGASANSDGEYSLHLKPGQYELLFRAGGYKQESRQIDLQNNTSLNVTLAAEVYQLNTVPINASGEDPAYAIIRKAIRKRKAHLAEVKAYTCDVYIKGLQKLLAAPKKFMGFDI